MSSVALNRVGPDSDPKGSIGPEFEPLSPFGEQIRMRGWSQITRWPTREPRSATRLSGQKT
jgi:hypothetical protein